MVTHKDYLRILSEMTARLPALDTEELKQTTEHAIGWLECEDCRNNAAMMPYMSPEEIAFKQARLRAYLKEDSK